ncbi:MAG: TetR/AcrR family transcriptional regulator [Leptospirales bacterium]
MDKLEKSLLGPSFLSKRHLSFDEARHHIIERAANLFAERRYDQVTLDGLIRILGIGKGTLYRYFSNKEELYSQILDLGHEQLLGLLRDVCDRTDIGPVEKLCEMAFSMAHFIRLHLDIFTVMAIEEPKDKCTSEKMIRYRKERIGMVVNVVEQGCRMGIFRPDMDGWLFSQSMMGALWAEALFPSPSEEPEGRPILRTQEIVALFLEGMLVSPVMVVGEKRKQE